ncbi:MAG: prolipoprotein diacylglyceryl transferase [Anaerolineales bacterium]
MNIDGVSLGPILIRWNGILIMIAVAIGGILATYEAKRRQYDSEIIFDFIFPMMIWGTLGARLWHVFTPPLSSVQLGLTTHHYLTHPLDFLAIWVGGLGFPGALIGGIFALFIFSRRNELNFGELADILTPALALGQVIGRFGNFLNQELYGIPTSVAWKIFISPDHRLSGYETIEFYHPLFAYDMILNLINLGFILWVSRRFPNKWGSGGLFVLYLLTSSLIRGLLEFLRLDVALIHGVNINQISMLGIVIISGIFLYIRNRSVQEL